MGETFKLIPLRVRFRAVDPLRLPEGCPGNLIRGAFGAALRRTVCVPPCANPRSCDRRDTCVYARMFEPFVPASGPSGLADRPRGLVLRAHHLDGRAVEPGECFHVDAHLFDTREESLWSTVEALRRMGSDGLGPRRVRAILETVQVIGADGLAGDTVYAEPAGWTSAGAAPLELSLAPDRVAAQGVLVRFVTATELKSGGGLARTPEFAVLMARVRDRLSGLRAIYGPGPLRLDFRAFGERAAEVELVRADLRQVRAARRSARSGSVHPLGGFVGEAEYRGDVAEFMPYLRAAKWTGVGRHTVWGNGLVEAVAVAGGASASRS